LLGFETFIYYIYKDFGIVKTAFIESLIILI